MLLAASAWVSVSTPAAAADRDALRHIVQQQCLPHWSAQHDPAPCESMAQDYAVLADRKGGAHFLLIATQTITGIEDPAVLKAATPNYFAAAWQARERLSAIMGHPLRRDAIGLAINSAIARGQDQLHIHIECLQPSLYHALQAAAASVGDHWAPLQIGESPYRALRIRGQDLGEANPIELLANKMPEARQAMARYTIIVAGMQFKDGPGFIVLAGPTPTRDALLGDALAGTLGKGLVAPGETQLDSTCAVDPAP
jgi:CDP-diacylglycerol pyrophosphatase